MPELLDEKLFLDDVALVDAAAWPIDGSRFGGRDGSLTFD